MAEIRRSPVEVGSLSDYLYTEFFTSQVVQDFSHQQYVCTKLGIRKSQQRKYVFFSHSKKNATHLHHKSLRLYENVRQIHQ